MSTRIKHRRGTAAQWAALNPVLAEGQVGFVTDTKNFKIGDGVTAWNDIEIVYIEKVGGGVIKANASTVVPLTLTGANGQTADLQQYRGHDGTLLSRVSNDGEFYKGASKMISQAEGFGLYETLISRTGATPGQYPVLQANGTLALKPDPGKILAISNWRLVTNPGLASYNWAGIAWSPTLKIFCMVAGTGNIVTSPDGETWTSRTTPVTKYWYDVVWAAALNLFVVIAGGGSGAGQRVITSPDGITWTARTTPADSEWNDLVWAPEISLFCAVAYGGTDRVMTSPDGVTWTSRSAAGAHPWTSVAWSPTLNLFVAVASPGIGLGTTNRVMTSPNGINWTMRTAPDVNWASVCWSSTLSMFCAVGNTTAGVLARVMTSPDGINWTLRDASSASQWSSVIWSPDLELFCACTGSAGPRAMTSPDGINWTNRYGPEFGPQRLAWSSELRIFAAAGSTGVMHSMYLPIG